MDLFDVLVARKYSDGGGGGGGGSCIVEPIVVTVNNTSANGKSIDAMFMDDNMNDTAFHLLDGYIDIENGTIQADAGAVATDTVYCLTNKTFMLVDYVDSFSGCTLSGGAELSEVMGMTVVVVSGDCTITVS